MNKKGALDKTRIKAIKSFRLDKLKDDYIITKDLERGKVIVRGKRADRRLLNKCISYPIANKFNTHPEKIGDLVDEITNNIIEHFNVRKT